jgi:hypothetical protein
MEDLLNMFKDKRYVPGMLKLCNCESRIHAMALYPDHVNPNKFIPFTTYCGVHGSDFTPSDKAVDCPECKSRL